MSDSQFLCGWSRPGPAGQVSGAGCGGQPGPQGVTERLLHVPAAAFSHPPPGPFHNPGSRAAPSSATKPLRVSPQMCEKFTVCQNSVEVLLRNNLNLPKVTEEDGCLLAGFNEARNPLRSRHFELLSDFLTFLSFQDKCLRKISKTFTSENQNVESLSYSTAHLARTIRRMVINPEEVIIPDAATQESLHTKLKTTKDWTEKITIHLILRDFTSFMEKTVRAVRYLKNTRSFSV
uniref:Interleukin-6 n=1 Tax=Ficedula albicollis TaxID=59894 RepID=A0A803VAI9_FICAL